MEVLRHTVVCHAAQENGVRKRSEYIDRNNTKSQFSCIHSSMMSFPNCAKFTVEFASMQGRPHSKFEQDLQDMSQQILVKIPLFFLYLLSHFAHFAKEAITHVQYVCSNLAEI